MKFFTSQFRIFFLVFFFLFSLTPVNGKKKQPRPVFKIAFGSCLDQNLEIKIWNSVLTKNPNIWLWLGDNIYKDTVDMNEKQSAYEIQKANPEYQILRKKTKVLGIWDDHDFGYNDVGEEYPMKKESKDLFLKFLDVPQNAEIRKHEGTYSVENIIHEGIKIKLILLDTRSFRSPLVSKINELGIKEYVANYEKTATILGEGQWNWLEKQLNEKSDVIIIVSSIQVLNDSHRFEKWGNFPLEREKLLAMIDRYTSGNAMFLSGDRHIAEIFQEKLKSGNTILDITSSSLNKPIPNRVQDDTDPRRISSVYAKENFGWIEISKEKQSIAVDISIQGIDEEALHTRINPKK
ncbi:alkaline phosphatase family protein [Leptospira ognonensis]|uniref:Alkaline phosphatase family protein n=1 Tax=Leptospira ognonensis TaxID=2484945 RepID=A0A4R9K4C7_9LEPT|nr:alkaline phosphatase D family protein [Leptospira ognonensis]TGL59158.1 alkaline phosphatase family protein [Leptospira ognonensis]